MLQFPALHLALGGAPPSLRTSVSLVASVALAGLAATFTEARVARALVALIFGVVLHAQLLAMKMYHAPIDLQIARAARAAWPDVATAMRGSWPWLALGTLVAIGAEWALLSGARRARFPHDRAASAVAFAVSIVLGPGLERGGPDLRFASALRVLGDAPSPRVSGSPSLPLLPSSRSRVPSVLLIVTESVRASDYASSPDEPASTNPEVAALLPQRIALGQMRAVASYTTISVAALTTGRAQLGTRQEIASAPNLFDFGRSVRVRGEPVWVAYYGAQSVSGVFERENIRASCDRFIGLEDLEAACEREGGGERCTRDTLDRRVVDVFEREIVDAPKPSIVVLHLYDTHVPYAFDEKDAKFTPYTREVSWEGLGELHNAYENAIVAQDRQIARAIRAFRASEAGAPSIVLFTSDHGEAFGEHHAIHHGQNLYDEQIHVPAFVDATRGALDDEARATLAERAKGPSSHYDVLPTILDALGVWDSPAFAPYRAPMLGSSLLRGGAPTRTVPMTSCNASYPCPLDTWGMLGVSHALVGQSWDRGFHCVKLDDAATPDDAPECAALRDASKRFFATLPGGSPNR